MSSGLELLGVDSFFVRLANVRKMCSPPMVTEALSAAATPMMEMAKTLAPFASGTLAGSIHMEPVVKGVKIVSREVYACQKEFGGTINALTASGMSFYWHDEFFTHMMSVYQEPRPFMRPAFDETVPEVIESMAAYVQAALDGGGVQGFQMSMFPSAGGPALGLATR